jgi:hypothetical protein
MTSTFQQYKNLIGIFSKKETSKLPPYYKGVNLKVNLEEGNTI